MVEKSKLMTFDKERRSRYRGHLNLCEIDLAGQTAICRARVLIVGAGGLGSPVAIYLAAAGVGHIGIVDADKVSLSNLQRQVMHGTDDVERLKTESAEKTMRRLNPDIEIRQYPYFLTSENADEIIGCYDLVMDCTDNYDTRLLISDTCVKLGKPFIFGGVVRFKGQVFTHLPDTADFRTYFGDEAPSATEPCSVAGILNSVVGVIGSLQATEAIKYLAGTGDLLINKLLVFDAITMQFNVFRL